MIFLLVLAVSKTPQIQAQLIATGIPARIAKISEKLGRDSLRNKTGVSNSQITRYSKGTSEATATNIIALAIAGQVSVEWLLTGKKDGTEAHLLETDAVREDVGDYNMSNRDDDISAIISIVSELENALNDSNKTLDPTLKGETVAAFFDMYRMSENTMEKGVLRRLLNTYVAGR